MSLPVLLDARPDRAVVMFRASMCAGDVILQPQLFSEEDRKVCPRFPTSREGPGKANHVLVFT